MPRVARTALAGAPARLTAALLELRHAQPAAELEPTQLAIRRNSSRLFSAGAAAAAAAAHDVAEHAAPSQRDDPAAIGSAVGDYAPRAGQR